MPEVGGGARCGEAPEVRAPTSPVAARQGWQGGRHALQRGSSRPVFVAGWIGESDRSWERGEIGESERDQGREERLGR